MFVKNEKWDAYIGIFQYYVSINLPPNGNYIVEYKKQGKRCNSIFGSMQIKE